MNTLKKGDIIIERIIDAKLLLYEIEHEKERVKKRGEDTEVLDRQKQEVEQTIEGFESLLCSVDTAYKKNTAEYVNENEEEKETERKNIVHAWSIALSNYMYNATHNDTFYTDYTEGEK